MIISTTEKRSVTTFLLVGSLLVLTGCFGEKEKKNDAVKVSENVHTADGRGDLLLSIDGKPVLYSQDFEDQKAMALQSDQRLQMILQVMPDAEYDMIFKSLEATHVLTEWVVREKLDQNPEFIKTLRQYQDAIYKQMCLKAYQDAHPLTVTEKEAKEYYEVNKDKIQGLTITSAGVETLCVKFADKEEAERFLHKVKDGSKKHFDAAAQESHVTVIPMVINAEGYADEVLKTVALSATKFPSKDMVKMTDGSYMVVGMIGKKDPEYHSFDLPEVKQGITQMCMSSKREEAQLADVKKLKKEYNVVEDRTYFDKKAEKAVNVQKSLQLAQELAEGAQNHSDDMDFEEDEIMFNDKI